MSLRTELEAFPTDAVVLVFTTLGHVYVGRIQDIEGDSVVLARSDGSTTLVLNLNDISGVREFDEEA